jgi:ADP-heptose:LPS heptosyltransferase
MPMSRTRCDGIVRGRLRGLYSSTSHARSGKGHADDRDESTAGRPSGKQLQLISDGNPGDVLMLTAAVRDLQLAFPGEYGVAVETKHPALWDHNPYIDSALRPRKASMAIDCTRPPLLEQCARLPRHYIESIHDLLARRLGREIPLTRFAPDLHLDAAEAASPPFGLPRPYWVIVAGASHDCTAKLWAPANYQRVVDHFQSRVRFVQPGAPGDGHVPLAGVVDLLGKTTLREFVRLIYHADGVVCPVTFAMHAAAAFDKACVVVAGGREPPHWEMYPTHQFLHTVGQLPCCRSTGCWKRMVAPLHEGEAPASAELCFHPRKNKGADVALCMEMIQPEEVCRAVERYLPSEVVCEHNARAAFDRAAGAAVAAATAGESLEKGIVIPGGGMKYFTCTWVCIRMLRQLGCGLPIELWHLGRDEMTEEMRGLVQPLGVRCIDAHEVRTRHPARSLRGFELKCYAILHSRFREVLLLDADNVPVVDPSFLFEAPQYRELGAVFWPDFGRTGPDARIWGLTGVAYRDEPEFESGQLVVDKHRCSAALRLAMWMNQNSDFWYRHIHGDKDAFRFAWHGLDQEYAMPSRPIEPLYIAGRTDGVMCQHDFEGNRIFQHRNFGKWTLDRPNPRIAGFRFEEDCLGHLAALEALWKGRLATADACQQPGLPRESWRVGDPVSF